MPLPAGIRRKATAIDLAKGGAAEHFIVGLTGFSRFDNGHHQAIVPLADCHCLSRRGVAGTRKRALII
jgi:hypothetical protein